MSSKWACIAGCLAGIILGAGIVIMSGLKLKFLLAASLLIFFPIFVRAAGSWRNALMALLITSLATQMSYNPFYSERYYDTQMGFRITLTGIILLLTYLGWILAVLNKRAAWHVHLSSTLPLFLLVVFGAVSYFFARKPDTTLFLSMLMVEGFLVYFYAANFIRSGEDIRLIQRWVAITVLWTGLLTIAQYYKPDFLNLKFMGWSEEPLKLHYGSTVIRRPSAFLGHANNVAAFLVAWLPLLGVSILGAEQKILKRWLEISAFLVGITALFLTFSRGGWLSFLLACALAAGIILSRRFRPLVPYAGSRLIVIMCVGVLLTAAFSPQIIRRLTRDDYQAGASRITLAKNAMEVFAQEPLRGVGLGYYLDFVPVPPHNIYLQTAVELGAVGLFLFLWFSWRLFRSGATALSSQSGTAAVFVIGLLAGLTAAYSHGMVELGTIAYHKFLTYLFIGGLLTGLARQRYKERTN